MGNNSDCPVMTGQDAAPANVLHTVHPMYVHVNRQEPLWNQTMLLSEKMDGNV